MSDLQGDSCLVESLRFEPGSGFFLLQRHLERLERSAVDLGFRCNVDALVTALRNEQVTLKTLTKVRLQLARSGRVTIESQAIAEETDGNFSIADQPVNSSNCLLSHKTTQREVFDAALARAPGGIDDVILWNERGELTETCRGNLIVQVGEDWLTPPLCSGLLPGTFRAELLSQNKIRESLLYLKDLTKSPALVRINSVRLWTRINLVLDSARQC